jgi:1,4-dihydroxy-2-naphthoate octaprenyltransferase
MDTDYINGLKTVPVMLGYKRTLKFLAVMTLISWFPIVGEVIVFHLPIMSLLLLLLSVFFLLTLDKIIV